LQELLAQYYSPGWKQAGQRGREIKRIANDDGEWRCENLHSITIHR
jgi:hypothetical protein